jgi:hypothetical protein
MGFDNLVALGFVTAAPPGDQGTPFHLFLSRASVVLCCEFVYMLGLLYITTNLET